MSGLGAVAGVRWRYPVLVFAAVLFLWQLGGHDLWAPDEPYFAEGAREMVVDGEWAVPHVNGNVTSDKPPLFFWLIALFSLPFGAVSSWTARLPSALAGLATVALTMRLGGRFFGPRTAALAGVVLCTTYLFWEKARWSQTDALLCCLIWIALSAFEAHRAEDADGLRAGLLFWLAAALAVLTKGPVGLLLPLGIALVVLISDGDLRRWRSFAPLAGPLLFAVVIGAWMVLATLGGGGDYSVWGALQTHFIDRGIHGLHHKRPVWYYLEVLPPNLLPWTALVPGALLLAWRRRQQSQDRFLLVAAVFVVLVFTVSTEKRELYALPAIPALALLTASLVNTIGGWREAMVQARPPVSRRWVTLAQGILGGLLIVIAVVLPFAARRVDEAAPWMAWLVAGLIATSGIAALVFAVRGRSLGAALAPAVGLACVYLVVVTAVYPAFEPRKSARPLAEKLVERTADSRARGVPVVAYAVGNLPKPLAFYSNGLYTEETEELEVLARHLARSDEAWAVVAGDRLDGLPEELRRRLFVVESTELARRPVLLLTNRPHPDGRPLSGESRPPGG